VPLDPCQPHWLLKNEYCLGQTYSYFYQQWNKSSGHRHDEDVDFPPMEISQKIDLVPSEKDYAIVDCAFSYLSLLHLIFEYSGQIAFFSETTLYMAGTSVYSVNF
jgi:hypothetical protein